jgi:hypothetical protein
VPRPQGINIFLPKRPHTVWQCSYNALAYQTIRNILILRDFSTGTMTGRSQFVFRSEEAGHIILLDLMRG